MSLSRTKFLLHELKQANGSLFCFRAASASTYRRRAVSSVLATKELLIDIEDIPSRLKRYRDEVFCLRFPCPESREANFALTKLSLSLFLSTEPISGSAMREKRARFSFGR